jgi:hypothetical protein
MEKEQKLFYKIPTKNKEGVYTFNNQINVIKEEQSKLYFILIKAYIEFTEAKHDGIIRQMKTCHVEDEAYKEAKSEIKFDYIPFGDKLDYIGIFTDENLLMFIIRPASRRQMDIINFEEFIDEANRRIKEAKELLKDKKEDKELE